MAILVDRDSRVVVQGITGHEGSFHTAAMLEFGTTIVAGVTPGKGGQILEFDGVKVPVYNTVAETVAETGADTSCIFVPPAFAADAACEAADAGIANVSLPTHPDSPIREEPHFFRPTNPLFRPEKKDSAKKTAKSGKKP